jgi:hypothetical protein
MEDEPHEVVILLLARMKSHPEEFKRHEDTYSDRWYDHVNTINAYGNEADRAALATGLREIRLGEVHELVMDELLNGDERRRKAEEEAEYERGLMMTQGRLAQQQQQQLQGYRNAIGQYNQAQAIGLAPSSKSVLPIANGGTGETLESTLGKLKKLVRR